MTDDKDIKNENRLTTMEGRLKNIEEILRMELSRAEFRFCPARLLHAPHGEQSQRQDCQTGEKRHQRRIKVIN